MENNPASVDISRESSFNVSSKPYACFPCGHVYGYFEPIKKKEEENSGGSEAQRHNRSSNNKRECPLCRQESTFVALSLGDEPAFHMDAEEPTYAFNPCGHTCSLATAKYVFSEEFHCRTSCLGFDLGAKARDIGRPAQCFSKLKILM